MVGAVGATQRSDHRGRADAAVLVAVYFLISVGYVVGQAAGYSLFVHAFGARDLPIALLLMPVLGIAVATVTGRVTRRWGVATTVVVVVAGVAVVSLVVRLGLSGAAPRSLLFGLPLWDAAVNNLNNLVVWTTASRLFDLAQAKRFGPIVSSGRSLALVLGGVAVPVIVRRIGTVQLYAVQTGCFIGAVLVLASLVRRRRGTIDEVPPARAVPRPRVRPDERYLPAVFGAVFLSMTAYVMVRNVFLDRGAARFPDPADYAGRIALLNAAQGALTFLSAFLVGGRFLRRFGVRGGLVALPTLLLAVYVPMAALDLGIDRQFLLASVGFVACGAVMFSIRTPTIQLLYQPLPPAERARAVSRADGAIEPAALGLAALVLLAVTRLGDWGATGMAGALAVISLGLAAIGPVVVRRYRSALVGALGERWLSGGQVDLDPSTMARLARQAPEVAPEEAVAMVDVVVAAGADPTPILQRLRHHLDPDVRAFALQGRAQRGDGSVLADALASLAATDPAALRRAAASIVGRSGDDAVVARMWAAEDDAVRTGALAGALAASDVARRDRAIARAEQWYRSGGTERVAALDSIGRTEAGGLGPLVLGSLGAVDLGERGAAVRAAGRLSLGAAADDLVGLLESELHEEAADALVAVGRPAVPAIDAALGRVSASGRRRLVRLLGRLEEPGGTEVLERLLDGDDGDLRELATKALWARHHRITSARGERLVAREVEELAGHRAAVVELVGAGSRRRVAELAAHDALHDARRRVALALRIVDPIRLPDPVVRGLVESDDRRRAYAVEALELALPSTFKPLVLPLFLDAGSPSSTEPSHHDAHQEGEMHDRFERILVLKQVGLFSDLGVDTLGDLADLVEEIEFAPDESVFAEGDDGTSMYVVAAGEVEMLRGGRRIDTRSKYTVFGELSLLDAAPRSAGVRAVGPTRLYRLDQEPFYELMTDRPAVLRRMIHDLVTTLRARLDDLSAVSEARDV